MNSKWKNIFYKGLICSFVVLYLLVAFISFYHCIAFCLVGNPLWISVMMSFAFEVGLALTLFSILTTDNKTTFVPWILMTFLTFVQVIGNVYSVYKYMVESGTNFYTYINDSMLHWFVEEASKGDIMSIISIILGALLPIVALLMTSMVSNNLKLWINGKAIKVEDDSIEIEKKDESEIEDTKEEIEKEVEKPLAQAETYKEDLEQPKEEDFDLGLDEVKEETPQVSVETEFIPTQETPKYTSESGEPIVDPETIKAIDNSIGLAEENPTQKEKEIIDIIPESRSILNQKKKIEAIGPTPVDQEHNHPQGQTVNIKGTPFSIFKPL